MIDLILKAETEGIDETEAVTLAAWYVATGMVNSTGSIGRFVDDVATGMPEEFATELADKYGISVAGAPLAADPTGPVRHPRCPGCDERLVAENGDVEMLVHAGAGCDYPDLDIVWKAES